MLQLPALESLIAKFVVRTPLLRSLVAPVSNWYMGATTARKYGNCRIEEQDIWGNGWCPGRWEGRTTPLFFSSLFSK